MPGNMRMSDLPDPPTKALTARRRPKHRASSESVSEILENMSDAFIALDREWHYTSINANTERITHLPREKILGRTLWQVLPTVSGTEFESACRRAMHEGVATHVEGYFAPFETWIEASMHPAAEGIH